MIRKINNYFHLSAKDISYVMYLTQTGELVHSYFGKKIRVNENYSVWDNMGGTAFSPKIHSGTLSLDAVANEYSAYGYCETNYPAYQAKNKDGNFISHLTYKSHKIIDDVSAIYGMPSLFKGDKNAQTLEITMADEYTGLEVVLIYTVFEEYNIIARNVRFINTSSDKITLNSAYSTCFGMKADNWDIIHFGGAWARERDMIRTPLGRNSMVDLSSFKGTSSHALNPFVMLSSADATETNGEVYSISLIYSGNHSTIIESNDADVVRVLQGICPMQFEWELGSGEEFVTPQSVMCYSDGGIGKISRELSDVFNNNLCKSIWTHKQRPVLINNWEGTYFDFNEEKLLAIAIKAKEAGCELFVLDDGWFGKRDAPDSSLGDWDKVYTKKLPEGIDGLCKKINAMGMDFGLWFEPEMISPDSELFRKHPDWAIQVKGREMAKGRNQYILDLSRQEICDYVVEVVCGVLSSANIKYVKWDMNRYMSDMPCAGYNHKYTLGLYNIMSRITEAFPEILFEGCSGGGGRFDLGILAYMPQIWTSDNTDAIARLKIQHSTSMGYPMSAISAHVTVTPNHQTGRLTPLKTRADIAYCGAFGYELDITKLPDDEFEAIKEQISFYKSVRKLMQTGTFYRLSSPFESNYTVWETVAKDKSEAYVMCCRTMIRAHTDELLIRLTGLDTDADYRDEFTGNVYGGDFLMYHGIKAEYEKCDYATFTMLLKKI